MHTLFPVGKIHQHVVDIAWPHYYITPSGLLNHFESLALLHFAFLKNRKGTYYYCYIEYKYAEDLHATLKDVHNCLRLHI